MKILKRHDKGADFGTEAGDTIGLEVRDARGTRLCYVANCAEVTDALRSYVDTKFERLERHYDHLTNVHVVLSVEKLVHKAEATVHMSGAEIFYPSLGPTTTGTLADTGSMTASRADHVAVRLYDGRVLVAGGAGPLATAEIFDPSAGTFAATGSMGTGHASR